MADTIKKIPLDQLSESTNLDDNDITIFQDESGTHKTKFKTLYDKVCNKVKEKFVNWVFDVKTKDKTLPGAINELLAANTQLNTDLVTINETLSPMAQIYGYGATLHVKTGSKDNLVYGCYDCGIYFYSPSTIGNPDTSNTWGGAMFTLRKTSTDSFNKVAFSSDGNIYLMLQDADGKVLRSWGKK